MSKNYLVQFGAGNPTLITGFSPTFVLFKTIPGGQTQAPPGITELPTGTGLYYFTYLPTNSTGFLIDGGASLSLNTRYISGLLDPIDDVDELLASLGSSNLAYGASITAQGVSLTAQGVSLFAFGSSITAQGNSIFAQGQSGFALGSTFAAMIGTTASSFGSTSSDPSTIYGYLKRLQEFNEGNSIFNKTSNLWDIYTRGSSTLLIEKALSDSAGIVSKT